MPTTGENRVFHGKIIVFGEYSVIQGSMALVFPFRKYSGKLKFDHEKTSPERLRPSHHEIEVFANYLIQLSSGLWSENFIDVRELVEDIQKGIYFDSDIPVNYGLGSSGALCAAVYDSYSRNKITLTQKSPPSDFFDLRIKFAKMESHFHGQSSGTDPLCIYSDFPLLLIGNHFTKSVDWKQLEIIKDHIFIIDTGVPGHTSSLVSHFKDNLRDEKFRYWLNDQYIPLVDSIIRDIIFNKFPYTDIKSLSSYQLDYFNKMIPEKIKPVWQYGIDTGLYAFKLCGSGGGGMVLGFTKKFTETQEAIQSQFNIAIQRLNF